MTGLILCALAFCSAVGAQSQVNRVDIVRHDAPELAAFGTYDIGVRTVELLDPDRPDVLRSMELGEAVKYDRRLTIEVWYPARLADGERAGGTYTTTTRDPAIIATLQGRAVRNATPLSGSKKWPLLIVSHGWPGNRYLMSHFGENLASKGYVVTAIDHRDSTYEDQQSIWSTLYNRPVDQLFVLDQFDRAVDSAANFLRGIVDAKRTGIVGYSMGGYGLLINMGSGYSNGVVQFEGAPPGGLALRHAADNPKFAGKPDARIMAGLAIAPWGMANGVWQATALEAITLPTFYLSGSLDATAGYEKGTRAIFENAINSERYLLTFENAGHNAIAPIPLPVEVQNSENHNAPFHYTDAVWDSVRSANIMNHFATAFFDYYLKGDTEKLAYLDLLQNSNDGVYTLEDGQETEAHTYWHGFQQNTARGLVLEHLPPAKQP